MDQGELGLAAKPAETGQRRGKQGIFGMLWDRGTAEKFNPLSKGEEGTLQQHPKAAQSIGNSLFPTTKWVADEVVWLQQLKAKLCHMAQD